MYEKNETVCDLLCFPTLLLHVPRLLTKQDALWAWNCLPLYVVNSACPPRSRFIATSSLKASNLNSPFSQLWFKVLCSSLKFNTHHVMM